MQLRRLAAAVIFALSVVLFSLGVSSGYDLYSEPHIAVGDNGYAVSGLSFIKVKGVFAPVSAEFTYKIYGAQGELIYTFADYTNGTDSYVNLTLTPEQVQGSRPTSVKTEVKANLRNKWAIIAGAVIALLSIAAFILNEVLNKKMRDFVWKEKNFGKVNAWIKRISAAIVCAAGLAVLLTGLIKPNYTVKDNLEISADGNDARITGTVCLQSNGCYSPDYVTFTVKVFDDGDNLINEIKISTAETVKNVNCGQVLSKGYPARIEVSAGNIEYVLMTGAAVFGSLTAAAGIAAFILGEAFYRKKEKSNGELKASA